MDPAADPSLPNALNTSNHGHGLAFDSALSVRYTTDGRGTNDVGSVQANKPAPCNRLIYYYEVQVRDRGELGRIGIGFSDKSFRPTRQPGWEANSYGYHGDDGHKVRQPASRYRMAPSVKCSVVIRVPLDWHVLTLWRAAPCTPAVHRMCSLAGRARARRMGPSLAPATWSVLASTSAVARFSTREGMHACM